jgi:hypothetical protein
MRMMSRKKPWEWDGMMHVHTCMEHLGTDLDNVRRIISWYLANQTRQESPNEPHMKGPNRVRVNGRRIPMHRFLTYIYNAPTPEHVPETPCPCGRRSEFQGERNKYYYCCRPVLTPKCGEPTCVRAKHLHSIPYRELAARTEDGEARKRVEKFARFLTLSEDPAHQSDSCAKLARMCGIPEHQARLMRRGKLVNLRAEAEELRRATRS